MAKRASVWESAAALCRFPTGNNLSDGVDITPQNLSILKTGKARAIRFSTLEAICEHLKCQPGNILEYRPEPSEKKRPAPIDRLEFTQKEQYAEEFIGARLLP